MRRVLEELRFRPFRRGFPSRDVRNHVPKPESNGESDCFESRLFPKGFGVVTARFSDTVNVPGALTVSRNEDEGDARQGMEMA